MKPAWSDVRSFFQQAGLVLLELVILAYFTFACFWLVQATACAAWSPICSSAGGLAIMVFSIACAFFLGAVYAVCVRMLDFADWMQARLALDALAALFAFGYLGLMQWQASNAEAAMRAAMEEASRTEAAAREAWFEALQRNPLQHGPPGIVPPMLQVNEQGATVTVTNTMEAWLTVSLARVREYTTSRGVQGWSACPLFTVGQSGTYHRYSIGPGKAARFAAEASCAAAFEATPLEYRVGRWPDETAWWSDSAFTSPGARALAKPGRVAAPRQACRRLHPLRCLAAGRQARPPCFRRPCLRDGFGWHAV